MACLPHTPDKTCRFHFQLWQVNAKRVVIYLTTHSNAAEMPLSLLTPPARITHKHPTLYPNAVHSYRALRGTVAKARKAFATLKGVTSSRRRMEQHRFEHLAVPSRCCQVTHAVHSLQRAPISPDRRLWMVTLGDNPTLDSTLPHATSRPPGAEPSLVACALK